MAEMWQISIGPESWAWGCSGSNLQSSCMICVVTSPVDNILFPLYILSQTLDSLLCTTEAQLVLEIQVVRRQFGRRGMVTANHQVQANQKAQSPKDHPAKHNKSIHCNCVVKDESLMGQQLLLLNMIFRISLCHLELNVQHGGNNFPLTFIYYKICFISYTLNLN